MLVGEARAESGMQLACVEMLQDASFVSRVSRQHCMHLALDALIAVAHVSFSLQLFLCWYARRFG